MSSPPRLSSPELEEMAEEIGAQLGAQIHNYTMLYTQQLVEEHQRRIEANQIERPRYIHEKRKEVQRGRQEGALKLFNDYFSDNPVFSEVEFRRRFRMRRHVFLRIIGELNAHFPYFQHRFDAVGRKGLSPYQKCTAAMRMLAWGVPANSVDEYIRIGESTAQECLSHFVEGVITIFEEEYMRRPNEDDKRRLLSVGRARGFPGMLGSIDCMHWAWSNCPAAWHGQYARGDHGYPTIILEAVASYDTWIWHSFFGVPGTNNDINVLDRSPVFDDIYQERGVGVSYTINDNIYDLGYYLADGIYPEYATLVQSIRHPLDPKAKLFAERQESCRKDVERAFGILKKRFAIIKGPAKQLHQDSIGKIMKACIIMHNMIVEDERDSYSIEYVENDLNINNPIDETINLGHTRGAPVPMQRYLENRGRVRDKLKHRQLKKDLMEHIWNREHGPN